MMAKLDFGSTTIDLPIHKEIMLGRGAYDGNGGCLIDLTPVDAMAMGVSRQHAVLKFDGQQWYLTDQGSTEGSWINDYMLVPFQWYPIEACDVIRLGQLQFSVS